MPSLRTLFGRQKAAQPTMEEATTACPHTAMIPRWDDPKDMGNEALASRFYCEACGETFGAEEARQLRATEAERLKNDLELGA